MKEGKENEEEEEDEKEKARDVERSRQVDEYLPYKF